MNPDVALNSSRYCRCDFDPPVELISAHFVTHKYVPHAHLEYVIAVIESGEAQLDHSWGRESLQAGSTVLIPPGVFHTGTPVTADGCRSSMFYVPVVLMDRAAASRRIPIAFPDRPIHFNDVGLALRLSQLHVLLAHEPDPPSRLRRRFNEVLGDLAFSMNGMGSFDRAGNAPTGLLAAREYIDANYLTRLTVDELAVIGGLSISHFIRAFRRAFGATPYLYLENRRIQHARAVIAAGEPISAVAFDCLFSDQSHLTRRFKRTWGVTPGVVSAIARTGRQRSA